MAGPRQAHDLCHAVAVGVDAVGLHPLADLAGIGGLRVEQAEEGGGDLRAMGGGDVGVEGIEGGLVSRGRNCPVPPSG